MESSGVRELWKRLSSKSRGNGCRPGAVETAIVRESWKRLSSRSRENGYLVRSRENGYSVRSRENGYSVFEDEPDSSGRRLQPTAYENARTLDRVIRGSTGYHWTSITTDRAP